MTILLGLAWGVAAALQLVLWLISRRTRNAGIVDVGWAVSFAIVVGAFAVTTDVPASSWAPIAAVVVAWSLRLTAYLVARGAATGPEEGRYRDLRARWQPDAERNFFVFFQAQAALVGVLAIAFVVPFVVLPTRTDALRIAGIAIAIVGLVGETVADAQLARWKRDPAHRGLVCDVGLWSVSRHPNYFFESLVWIGYAIHAVAYPRGWIAFLAPAVIVFSIVRVTGIPATEAQALRSRGDRYRAYQRRVSAFVPWFPRKIA